MPFPATFSLMSACTLFMMWSVPALAATNTSGLDSGDTAWMLACTALVLLMTIPGLVLFDGGQVRKKNIVSTAIERFTVCCVVSVLWAIIGHSLAFGYGGFLNEYIGGFDKFMLNHLTKDALIGTIPESVYIIFQMTFAIITVALICGAFADRMKFSAVLWFSGLWLLIAYAPIAHWVWGGGFLAKSGVLDFAGGMVVHLSAGVAGLIAALVVGRRHGLERENIAPNNLVYSIAGASLLWVGWFGFNGGSALAANGSAGMAIAATQIAAATGALSWMCAEWLTYKKPSALGIISGALTGLVAITPASGYVTPGAALLIGAISGVACFFACTKLKSFFGYDDALDVFGIHGIGGIVGTVLTGVFAAEAIGGTSGLLEGNLNQLWLQLYGAAVTILWSAFATFIILRILSFFLVIKVAPKEQIEGLDLHLHGESVT